MLNIKRLVNVETVEWEKLIEQSENGTIGDTLQSGDLINITMEDGENINLRIGRDEKGKLYFAFDDCLMAEHHMNDRYTNKGGWAKSEMRRYLNDVVFKKLPPKLQAAIKPTTIVQIIDGKRVETSDKLFLFSYTQMFGGDRYADFEPEDTQLDIFLTEKSRVKECGDHGTWFYFLRTPSSGGSNYFCSVYSYGTANINGASGSIGVAPGFCI